MSRRLVAERDADSAGSDHAERGRRPRPCRRRPRPPAEYSGIDAKTLHSATKSRKVLSVVPGTLHGVDLVHASVRRAVDAFVRAHAR